VHYELEGEEAERFLRYERTEFIKSHAVAGRKLMFERLAEWEKGRAGEKVA
jgi:hypothetical protein